MGGNRREWRLDASEVVPLRITSESVTTVTFKSEDRGKESKWRVGNTAYCLYHDFW